MQTTEWNLETIRQQVVGVERQTPLLDGQLHPYICLDNAASTPALRPVQQKVDEFLEWYSSVHRGEGFKSRLCTWAYDEAHRIVLRLVGGDPEYDMVFFGKNSTEVLNAVAYHTRVRGERVLSSLMEHHSNFLPWRADGGLVDYVDVLPDGRLDEADLVRKLEQYGGEVKLVAVTGASNVSGYVNPVHRLAEIAHRYGARILVDAAQLAPHRRVVMGAPDDPGHLDFVVLSAHKMYAPFGTGALIGPREFFAAGAPFHVGGGVVKIVTEERTVWSDPDEREEAGSPNVVGGIALAAAAEALTRIGWDAIEQHERELTAYALRELQRVPGLRILGSADPDAVAERLGVLTFTLGDIPHSLTAAILAYEYGIGVRNGCFCAHPYLLCLLDVPPEESERYQTAIMHGDRTRIPGAVRASLGIYNTRADVDALVTALQDIVAGRYRGVYVQDVLSGAYAPQGYQVDFEAYFSFRVA